MRKNRVAIQTVTNPEIKSQEIKSINIEPLPVTRETKASKKESTQYTVKTNGSNLHVRSGPSTSYKILTKMPLMIVTPGKAEFMSTFKESSKIQEIKKLLGYDRTSINRNNNC